MNDPDKWAEALIYELQQQGWDRSTLNALKEVAPIFLQRAMEDSSTVYRRKYSFILASIPPVQLLNEIVNHLKSHGSEVTVMEKEGSYVDIPDRLTKMIDDIMAAPDIGDVQAMAKEVFEEIGRNDPKSVAVMDYIQELEIKLGLMRLAFDTGDEDRIKEVLRTGVGILELSSHLNTQFSVVFKRYIDVAFDIWNTVKKDQDKGISCYFCCFSSGHSIDCPIAILQGIMTSYGIPWEEDDNE